jgi:hypothetical protein
VRIFSAIKPVIEDWRSRLVYSNFQTHTNFKENEKAG